MHDKKKKKKHSIYTVFYCRSLGSHWGSPVGKGSAVPRCPCSSYLNPLHLLSSHWDRNRRIPLSVYTAFAPATSSCSLGRSLLKPRDSDIQESHPLWYSQHQVHTSPPDSLWGPSQPPPSSLPGGEGLPGTSQPSLTCNSILFYSHAMCEFSLQDPELFECRGWAVHLGTLGHTKKWHASQLSSHQECCLVSWSK